MCSSDLACGIGPYASLQVAVNPACRTASRNEEQSLEVYPNPTAGDFTAVFSLEQEGMYELTLNDVVGKALLTVKGTAHPGVLTVPVRNAGMPAGMYLLRIRKPGGDVACQRIIIE